MILKIFKGKRKIYLTLAIILTSVTLLLSIEHFSDKPPFEKIETSRKLISKARREQAEKYASEELNSAEKCWAKAIEEWKVQNEKSSAFRDFAKVHAFSEKAIKLAEQAIKKSVKTREDLSEEIVENLQILKKDGLRISQLSQKLPINHGIRENITPANLKLDEAEQAFKRYELLTAKKKIDQVKPIIQKLKKQTKEIISEYFESYNTWKNNHQLMIDISKEQHCVTLVVDKFSRTCKVYKSGKLIHEFETELGANWIGYKRFRGDMATPEGVYKVIKKKHSKETKYYKAMLINYPNDEDKIRFERAKEAGRLTKRAEIGGLVEIHGHGGKGADWTEGCVAIENQDMDKLFSLCPIGTQIAIIGSIKPLDEIIDF